MDIGKRNAFLNGILLIALAVLLAGIGMLLAMLPAGGGVALFGAEIPLPERDPGSGGDWLILFLAIAAIFMVEGGLWQIRTGRPFKRLKAASPIDIDSMEAPRIRRLLDPVVAAAVVAISALALMALLRAVADLFWTGQMRVTPVLIVYVLLLVAYGAFAMHRYRRLRAGEDGRA